MPFTHLKIRVFRGQIHILLTSVNQMQKVLHLIQLMTDLFMTEYGVIRTGYCKSLNFKY